MSTDNAPKFIEMRFKRGRLAHLFANIGTFGWGKSLCGESGHTVPSGTRYKMCAKCAAARRTSQGVEK